MSNQRVIATGTASYFFGRETTARKFEELARTQMHVVVATRVRHAAIATRYVVDVQFRVGADRSNGTSDVAREAGKLISAWLAGDVGHRVFGYVLHDREVPFDVIQNQALYRGDVKEEPAPRNPEVVGEWRPVS